MSFSAVPLQNRSALMGGILLSALLLGACTPRKEKSAEDHWGECYTNVECSGGKICVANKCVIPPRVSLSKKVAPVGMVYIPSGPFILGNNDGTIMERPQRNSLTAEFFMDRTEVSRADYMQCVREGVCSAPSCKQHENPSVPVFCVTHKDARRYCSYRQKRLPTEEEWEKAARGVKAQRYPWGEEPPACHRARFAACKEGIGPVGSKPQGASPFGTLDQAGNVWEWTDTRNPPWDRSADPRRKMAGYGAKPATGHGKSSPPVLAKDHYVIRGGSYRDDAAGIRSTVKQLLPADFFSPLLGFRCVKEVK